MTDLLGPEAEAAHSGVELEVDGDGAIAGDARECLKIVLSADDGGEPLADNEAMRVGEDATHDQHGRGHARFPQLEALFGGVDREELDAVALELQGDTHEAMTIGVGLDDGAHASPDARESPNGAQVVPHRTEIDLGRRGPNLYRRHDLS